MQCGTAIGEQKLVVKKEYCAAKQCQQRLFQEFVIKTHKDRHLIRCFLQLDGNFRSSGGAIVFMTDVTVLPQYAPLLCEPRRNRVG